MTLAEALSRAHGAVRAHAGNDPDADDALQEAAARCLDAGISPDAGWLVTVARNWITDQRRHLARFPRLPAPEPARQAPVGDVLGGLPVWLRETVALRAEGLSYAEIAAETRVRPATVGTRLLRARALLAS